MTNHEPFLSEVFEEFQDHELVDICRKKLGTRDLTEDEQRKALFDATNELTQLIQLRAGATRIKQNIVRMQEFARPEGGRCG